MTEHNDWFEAQKIPGPVDLAPEIEWMIGAWQFTAERYNGKVGDLKVTSAYSSEPISAQAVAITAALRGSGSGWPAGSYSAIVRLSIDVLQARCVIEPDYSVTPDRHGSFDAHRYMDFARAYVAQLRRLLEIKARDSKNTDPTQLSAFQRLVVGIHVIPPDARDQEEIARIDFAMALPIVNVPGEANFADTGGNPPDPATAALDPLTDAAIDRIRSKGQKVTSARLRREMQVAACKDLHAKGLPLDMIAERLDINIDTVRRRLGIRT